MVKLFGLFRKSKELRNINANDTKIKVKSADIVVSGTATKLYFEIKYYTLDDECHIGYSSYNLNFVFDWLKECFEILD